MITEYEDEPVPGLPGHLPPGEAMLWQGAPDRRTLARTAFHTRGIGAYFAALTVVAAGAAALGAASWIGVAATAAVGGLSVGLLHVLAWASARSTLYTLTSKRIVLRFGIALPTCINLPLSLIASADLADRGDGAGDIALTVSGSQRLGWIGLWPHARPWRLARPEPMLRALPDAAGIAALIARTCLAVQPQARMATAATPDHAPDFTQAVAA